ncbi:MAG TPA: type 2 lanthipeptide synthetase LanM family protein [Xanthobacteraceae bacterium]|jgi:type 2 lantibiotic biosynthesis protein LanM|nr:type 2 lanthipeptide synthetase LanM family protein [Xanthobacteraceae bacterium]
MIVDRPSAKITKSETSTECEPAAADTIGTTGDLLPQLAQRSATIDELLSATSLSDSERVTADLVARRLAAWQRASAAGDPSLFQRRLERDGLTVTEAERRLGFPGPSDASGRPSTTTDWLADAAWIAAAMAGSGGTKSASAATQSVTGALPFADLLVPVVDEASELAWRDLTAETSVDLTAAALEGLRTAFLAELCELCAPVLYECFSKARSGGYAGFVTAMKASGFVALFEAKPVLLRLIAVLTRQWIDTSREFVIRLAADRPALRGLLLAPTARRVVAIEAGLSDRHNGGRSVLTLTFEDGSRLLYKPKDLRLDAAWQALVERLNAVNAPLQLRAVRALPRDGYGWTEFIAHDACADAQGCDRYFRNAGALLALLHGFAATDMHQENVIAAGEYPVPVDLETILQPSAEEHKANDAEGEAFDAAMEIIGNSVMTVGLLPAYGRSVDNNVFAMGGMTPDWNARYVVTWNDVNSDAMRPVRVKEQSPITPNLPHVGGRYAKFTDHVDSFTAGFADYAAFLMRYCRAGTPEALLAGFAGLPVRKVIRPTRFYYMLLQRLKDQRSMDDGVIWSAQADFVARLSEWDDEDPLWPLHRAERSALLTLNVPHFTTPSDGTMISDAGGVSADTVAISGYKRARARLQNLDEREIAWQADVIRENTRPTRAGETKSPPLAESATTPPPETFTAEASRIADEIASHAIRRGASAAWIGLDWLGDAEVFQLVCLGPDLYNGTTGLALFLAGHAAATGSASSAELARAALAYPRKNLKSRSAARMARSLGIGGAIGIGSIVYGFATIAKLLRDDNLLADAQHAAALITDDLIVADKQLDVMGGAAGAILALLRLNRDTGSSTVLERAVACGEHLLRQSRLGEDGRRSWVGQGSGNHALNGMSHGAAGYAYALAALAAAAGREDFAQAAAECLAFEDASYDATRHNWPDLRGGQTAWPSQWCHGGCGVGLARLAIHKRAGTVMGLDQKRLATDIGQAIAGVTTHTPTPVDTLCCGTLGGIEFFCEAAITLDRADLRERAARRLNAVLEQAHSAGDYRWNSGQRQFNLGLFRGLAGVGYTLLRQAQSSSSNVALPNVLIWE